jgi:RHS repeat-associated protein
VSLTRVPATGQLASVGVGSVVTSVAFNGYGEASSRSVPSLYSEALTYDAAGRIVLVNEVVEGVASQFVYTNDSQGRLTSVSVNSGPATTWTYSSHGNRLTENGLPSTYDAQDRLLSRGATTYTWDAMGSRLSMSVGGQTTQYVHEGRALKSVTLPDRTVVGYEYDGRQRRIARTRNGVVTARWVYDGQYRVVAEVDASGAVTSRFIYASEGHSPDAMVRGGVTYAYVKNHLGTVKLVVNEATGAVAQRIECDAWGNVVSDSNPGFQPFIFAGGVFDNDTRLTHFGFRDYDSTIGSWLSPEPLSRSPGYVAGMAQTGMGVPTYSYAANTPLRYVDPDGRRFINPTRRQRDAIDALIANPLIGDTIRALDESDDILISFREEPGFKKGAFTDYTPGSKASGCQPRQPASVVITYDEDVSSALLSKYFGLDVTTLVNILAHELGHTDYAHDVWWNGLEPIEGGSESRAIGFEDLTRSGSYRRRHDVILGAPP